MSIDLIGSALALVHVWPAGTGFVLTADLPLTDEEDEEEEEQATAAGKGARLQFQMTRVTV